VAGRRSAKVLQRLLKLFLTIVGTSPDRFDPSKQIGFFLAGFWLSALVIAPGFNTQEFPILRNDPEFIAFAEPQQI